MAFPQHNSIKKGIIIFTGRNNVNFIHFLWNAQLSIVEFMQPIKNGKSIPSLSVHVSLVCYHFSRKAFVSDI